MTRVWVPTEPIAKAIASLPGVHAEVFGGIPDGRAPANPGDEAAAILTGSGAAADGADVPPPGADEVEFYVPPFFPTGASVDVLGAMPKLRVVQTLTAGVDRFAPRIPPGTTLCNARGVHDPGTAEWAVAAMLASLHDFDRFAREQAAGRWDYRVTGRSPARSS